MISTKWASEMDPKNMLRFPHVSTLLHYLPHTVKLHYAYSIFSHIKLYYNIVQKTYCFLYMVNNILSIQ